MHEKPEPTPSGWPILPRHNQPFTPPIPSKHQCATQPILQITTFKCQICVGVFQPRHATAGTGTRQLCPGVFHPRHAAARNASGEIPLRAPHRATGLHGLHCWGGPKKCGHTSSCKTQGVKWLLKNELAAEITCHTQRKTDRVKASHHELTGSTRRAAGRRPPAAGRNVAIQQLGAELTHAAIGACVPASCAPGAASRQEITFRPKKSKRNSKHLG
jgi:hypothetical protein